MIRVRSTIVPGLLCLALACLQASAAHAARALEIAAGGNSTCAIIDGGLVYCWGSNKNYLLGGGEMSHSGLILAIDREDEETFRNMRGLSVAHAVEGSGEDGGMHACAVSIQNEAWCWGRRSSGRLGSPSAQGTDEAFAKRVTWANHQPLTGVVQIAAGGAHTCALRDNGRVYCWGRSELGGLKGLLGQNSLFPTAFQEHPHPEGAVRAGNGGAVLENIAQIALGRAHACALRLEPGIEGGSVWCWGISTQGQTGSGRIGGNAVHDYADRVRLNANTGIDDAVAIAAGVDHSCAILVDRRVVCWGANNFGQAGHEGSPHPTAVPWAQLVRIGSATNSYLDRVDSITLGYNHSCARTRATSVLRSNVLCWGHNSYGVLGINLAPGEWTTRATSIPQASADLPGSPYFTNIEQLAAGQTHTCALHRQNRDIRCWGRNHKGQLGYGEEYGDALPHPVPHPSLAVSGIDGQLDPSWDNLFHDGFD